MRGQELNSKNGRWQVDPGEREYRKMDRANKFKRKRQKSQEKDRRRRDWRDD